MKSSLQYQTNDTCTIHIVVKTDTSVTTHLSTPIITWYIVRHHLNFTSSFIFFQVLQDFKGRTFLRISPYLPSFYTLPYPVVLIPSPRKRCPATYLVLPLLIPTSLDRIPSANARTLMRHRRIAGPVVPIRSQIRHFDGLRPAS